MSASFSAALDPDAGHGPNRPCPFCITPRPNLPSLRFPPRSELVSIEQPMPARSHRLTSTRDASFRCQSNPMPRREAVVPGEIAGILLRTGTAGHKQPLKVVKPPGQGPGASIQRHDNLEKPGLRPAQPMLSDPSLIQDFASDCNRLDAMVLPKHQPDSAPRGAPDQRAALRSGASAWVGS